MDENNKLLKIELLEIVENSYINFVDDELIPNIREEIKNSPICRNRVVSPFGPGKNVSKYFNDIMDYEWGIWVNQVITEIEVYLQKENFYITEIFDRDCISKDISKEICNAFLSEGMIAEFGCGFTTPVLPGKISVAASAVCEGIKRFVNPSMVLSTVGSGLQKYKSYYVVNSVKQYFSRLFEQSFEEGNDHV